MIGPQQLAPLMIMMMIMVIMVIFTTATLRKAIVLSQGLRGLSHGSQSSDPLVVMESVRSSEHVWTIGPAVLINSATQALPIISSKSSGININSTWCV